MWLVGRPSYSSRVECSRFTKNQDNLSSGPLALKPINSYSIKPRSRPYSSRVECSRFTKNQDNLSSGPLALKPINSYSIKPRKCRVHPCCLGVVTLYFLIRRRVYIAAIFFGLAVHLKLFLVIYSIPINLFIKGGLYLKPTKLEHIFVAVITFFPFLLWKYFWYQLVAYCVCFKMIYKKSL